MKLTTLPQIVERPKKRIGRGHGSGKVKTAGRGQKGQKARGRVWIGYEGGQVSLRHSLPYIRGKARNKSQKEEVVGVALHRLKVFTDGDTISLDSLIKKGVIDQSVKYVKLIGKTELLAKLVVQIPCSAGAKLTIEKAGGTVKE